MKRQLRKSREFYQPHEKTSGNKSQRLKRTTGSESGKLRHYFDTLECEYRTWEQIYDKKWTNKTTPEAKAMEEIKAAVIGAETDVRAIRALKSDFESTLLASYRSGKTLTECLAMLPMLEKEKAASSEPADETQRWLP